MDSCEAFFRAHCYTEERIYRYKRLWRTGIVRYMEEKGVEEYSPAIGAEFMATCHHDGIVRPQEQEKIRSVQVLDDMLQLGHIRKRCFSYVVHHLDGVIGKEMEKLISHLTNLRRSTSTIKEYRLYLSEFLAYLVNNGVSSVSAIAEHHIVAFVSRHPTNKVNVVSALRVLFRFWEQEHIVEDRHEDLFSSMKARTSERVPSYFSPDEVMKIEQSVKRTSGVGKRNYAMVLLASRLGLRASDIAGLSFGNIDWEKNVITLQMKKTSKAIELPLLAEVGNAIVDYLRCGRPKSALHNVFLSSRAPYVAATSEMVCGAINMIIEKSGIDVNGKRHGPHSLRHSLASAMLGAGATLPVISESLGHRSTETTLAYLKIDIDALLKCALPVTPVPTGFYLQRGGAFYG